MSKVKTKKVGGKKRALKISLIIASVLVILGVVAFLVFGVILKEDEPYTFGFSGVVYADGAPLQGAKVSCEVMQTTTDENGYYSFTGVKDVVEVTVSKDGYLFPARLVYVSKDSENIDFSGFEIFSMEGVVKNGNEVIVGANINVSSKAGEYKTKANNLGQFYLPNLAGEVTLTATKENLELFSQVFDKSKIGQQLVVTGTTTVVGRVVCDSTEDLDFNLTLNDESVNLGNDNTFEISGIKPNSQLCLYSENYFVEDPVRVISIENAEIVFHAYKYYNVNGRVLSGEYPIEGVKVVANMTATKTGQNGQFFFENLYGQHEIVSKLNGFRFETITTSYQNCTDLQIFGTVSVSGKVTTDDNSPNGIEVVSGGQKTTTNYRGEYTLSGIILGSVISVNTQDYFVENNGATITGTNNIDFTLKKYYKLVIDLTYDGAPLPNGKAIIGKKSYSALTDSGKITVEKLYGTHMVILEVDGFKFTKTYSADYLHTTISATPYKIFTLSGDVKCGDKVVQNATITLARKSYSATDGTFNIPGLYESGSILVSADGYNTKTVSFSLQNSNVTVNLTYDVTGVVTSGNVAVSGAEIFVNGESKVSSASDGGFRISNLSGKTTLTATKQYYKFETIENISSGSNVFIDGSYTIMGTAMKKTGVSNETTGISGLKVILFSQGTDEEPSTTEQTTNTDEDGNFQFEDLKGRYLLYFDTEFKEVQLLPSEYIIVGGGVYNFADNGYKIKGRVTSGGLPVSGVKVEAGDMWTMTDDDGYYKFDLLIADTTLVLSKNGYDFSSNDSFDVTSADDKREDVNFTCSYSISGQIHSGSTPLVGVSVGVGENTTTTTDDGRYTLSNLSGNVDLQIKFGDYLFIGPSSISAFGEYDFVGVFDTTFTILTGDVPVAGVRVLHGDTDNTSGDDGRVTITGIQLGDSISFEKADYVFDSVTIESIIGSMSVHGSYSISGSVQMVGRMLSGVKVSVVGGENSTITDDSGHFQFSGLEGRLTFAFEKESMNFDNVEVSGSGELTIKAKFGASGKVLVVGAPLANVKVSAGDIIVYSGEDGGFEINGITEIVNLTFEKQGYTFNGDFVVDQPKTFNVVALYSIMGYVKSGQNIVAGAMVRLSNGQSTNTNNDGYFKITGIEERVNITITASGFDTLETQYYSDFTPAFTCSLTYKLTINFTNFVGLKDITIDINGTQKNYSLTSVELTNLSGTTTVSISKDGYKFTPDRFVASKQTTQSVTIKQIYTISGKITTDSGLPVKYATVTAGGKSVTTGDDGGYTITGLTDTSYVKVNLSVKDSIYNGEDFNFETTLNSASSNATINYDKVPADKYMYFLFKRAYQNLSQADFYQIYGKGTVSVDAGIMKTQQQTRMVYKKDISGNRLFLNFNQGGKIAGVDPNVAHFTYTNLNNDTAKAFTVRGTENIKSTDLQQINLGNVSWSDVSYSDSIKNYGVNPEGFYPYTINQNTISSVTEISSTSDGGYSFKFTLQTTEEMYNVYTNQMKFMCSAQTFQSFENAILTFTMDRNGDIARLVIDEVYKVKSSGFNATVTDNFTYEYFINKSNDQVKIDTAEEIKKTLVQTQSNTVVIGASTLVQILFDDKRRVVA